MSGASLGKVFGTLPCFATSFDAGADVGLEFTFFGCRATCRRTASLCRAVALCGAVPRASGGFQTSEYVPAPKAVGASAAVNNASPSLRTLSPLPSGLQNGFANAPQAFEGSGLTGPTTRARPAPTNPSPQTSQFPAWEGSPLGPHPTTASLLRKTWRFAVTKYPPDTVHPYRFSCNDVCHALRHPVARSSERRLLSVVSLPPHKHSRWQATIPVSRGLSRRVHPRARCSVRPTG
jgi:hypothetical protein